MLQRRLLQDPLGKTCTDKARANRRSFSVAVAICHIQTNKSRLCVGKQGMNCQTVLRATNIFHYNHARKKWRRVGRACEHGFVCVPPCEHSSKFQRWPRCSSPEVTVPPDRQISLLTVFQRSLVEKSRNISAHPKDFVPSCGIAPVEALKVSLEEPLCNLSSLDSLGVQAGLDVLKRSLPTSIVPGE